MQTSVGASLLPMSSRRTFVALLWCDNVPRNVSRAGKTLEQLCRQVATVLRSPFARDS